MEEIGIRPKVEVSLAAEERGRGRMLNTFA